MLIDCKGCGDSGGEDDLNIDAISEKDLNCRII